MFIQSIIRRRNQVCFPDTDSTVPYNDVTKIIHQLSKSVIGVQATPAQEAVFFSPIKHHDEMKRFVVQPYNDQQAMLDKLVRFARQQERNPRTGSIVTVHADCAPVFGVERALAWPHPTQHPNTSQADSDAEEEVMPTAGPSGVMRPINGTRGRSQSALQDVTAPA